MAKRSLTAGFTGDVDEKDRLSARAKSTLQQARDEAGMVVAHAVDHPTATGSALVAAGMVGLAVGYLLGISSRPRHRYWR